MSSPARSRRRIPVGDRNFLGFYRKLPGTEDWLPRFLGEAYVYKEISDYGSGKRAAASEAEAREAVETAKRFVDRVAALLAS